MPSIARPNVSHGLIYPVLYKLRIVHLILRFRFLDENPLSDRRGDKRKSTTTRGYKKDYKKERSSYYERDNRIKDDKFKRKEYRSSDIEVKSKMAVNDEDDEKNKKDTKPPIIKEKPNFNATGILARETNTVKYHQIFTFHVLNLFFIFFY